jgi:Putative peptidoglycan binding domain
MGALEVERFLSSITVDSGVNASTQNQASAAIFFSTGIFSALTLREPPVHQGEDCRPIHPVISNGSNKVGERSPRADGRAARGGRWCALAVVLALLLGCGKLTTRPTGGTPAEPKPGEETKSTGAMGPVNRDLMRVQRRLKELGHDPGPIDGRLGLQTQAALKAFQTDYGLAATGEIDAETRAALGLGRKGSP